MKEYVCDRIDGVFGFDLTPSENEIVAQLFKMYQELVK